MHCTTTSFVLCPVSFIYAYKQWLAPIQNLKTRLMQHFFGPFIPWWRVLVATRLSLYFFFYLDLYPFSIYYMFIPNTVYKKWSHTSTDLADEDKPSRAVSFTVTVFSGIAKTGSNITFSSSVVYMCISHTEMYMYRNTDVDLDPQRTNQRW